MYIIKILLPPVETFLQYSINHVLQLCAHMPQWWMFPGEPVLECICRHFRCQILQGQCVPGGGQLPKRPCRVAFQGEFITAGAQTSAMQVLTFGLVNAQSWLFRGDDSYPLTEDWSILMESHCINLQWKILWLSGLDICIRLTSEFLPCRQATWAATLTEGCLVSRMPVSSA